MKKVPKLVPVKTEEEILPVVEKIYKIFSKSECGRVDIMNCVCSIFTTELLKRPYNERLEVWNEMHDAIWKYLEAHPEVVS